MFSKALALTLAAGAAVQAHNHHNGTWTTVTEVVDTYTTYCPEPTHLTMNQKTYTVTEACTYTITDCPCTVTKTIPENPTAAPTNGPGPVNNGAGNNNAGNNAGDNNANNAGNNNAGNNNANPSGNMGPSPTAAPPTAGNECPSGQNCPPPVVAGAGQNAAAYGVALAGAIAAAAIAL